MRRAYRRPYSLPSHLTKTKKDKEHKPSTPLVQPDWDDTIHDLTALKASPQDVLKRKLSRTSRNQMGMALLAKQCTRSGQSGGQERYTPSASQGDSSDDESPTAQGHPGEQRQQQQYSPGAATRHSAHHFDLQQHADAHMQQQHERSPGSVLAKYAFSTTDSEEDVCQWQSPIRPAAQQWQRQRHVLHDIQNSPQRDVGAGFSAVRHHEHSSWQQQQTPGQYAGHRDTGAKPSSDALSMSLLLDKISELEQQLHKQGGQQVDQPQQQQEQECSSQDLRQLLSQSQQQLSATQQQLHKLQDEHRQYVAHTSTLLTQLQTQVQQLLTGNHSLPPLPGLLEQQHKQQQQQVPPSGPYYSRNLQPAPVGQQHFDGVIAGDSSTARVQQISSYIQQQLQEQQPQAPAGLRPHPYAANEASCASNHSGRTAGLQQPSATAAFRTGSPSKTAAGRLAGSAAGSACSSPSRRRADLHFTPAVADTVALPSYAAMRKQAALAGGSPTRSRQGSLRGAAAAGADAHGSAGAYAVRANHTMSASNDCNRDYLTSSINRDVDVGSPQRLHTTPVPQPLAAPSLGFGTISSKQGVSDISGVSDKSSSVVRPYNASELSDAAQPHLAVRLPSARVAAAAVWEAELASPSGSDRPQQMQFLPEATHYHLSNANAESVRSFRPSASAAGLSTELAILLKSLGLAGLDVQASVATESAGAAANAAELGVLRQLPGSVRSSAGALRPGSPAAKHDQRAGSNAPVVLSETAAAPAAATAPRMLGASRGDGVLTGLQDVDRGLSDALPQAAVSRVFTAAGCVSDRGEGLAPRPRVLAGQLRGNVCLKDHLRAAAQAGTH